jgi:hypothetical protein
MDLLTAVMHEMGHLLGIDHAPDGSHDVMEDTLGAGVRRVPAQDQGAVQLDALSASLAASVDDGSIKRKLARAADQYFSDPASVADW